MNGRRDGRQSTDSRGNRNVNGGSGGEGTSNRGEHSAIADSRSARCNGNGRRGGGGTSNHKRHNARGPDSRGNRCNVNGGRGSEGRSGAEPTDR